MSRRRLLLTLLAASTAAAVYPTARRRALQWGATPAEVASRLPGDDLVAPADLVATRGISVATPADAVWPWVAQLGQGRGGFYSYDRLENLVGCDIHSADRVVEEWQDVEVGDEVRLAPEFALTVGAVEHGRALVLHGAAPVDDEGPMPFDFSWAFVVEPLTADSCRLLVRERYGYRTSWAGRMVEPVSWVSLLMTQRMLRGIRDRAEH